MKSNALSILAGLIVFAGLSQATALTGNTADITVEADSSSSGLHAVGSGSFTFNTPVNGTVIGLSDLTDFNLTLSEQFAYGWGVTEPIETYTLGLANLNTFSFDTSNEDSLYLNATINGTGPDTNTYNTLRIEPGNATDGLFLFPEVAFIGNAYGLVDPSTPASAVPEPGYLAMAFGLMLFGVLGRKFRSKQ